MSHPGFHNKIEVGGQFPPEKGRYLLYVSLSCPYAHRALISYALKGLQDVIPVINVHPVQSPLDKGLRTWVFGGAGAEVTRPPGVENNLKAAEAARAAGTVTFPDFLTQLLNDIDFRNTTCAGVDVTDPITHRELVKTIYEDSDSTYDGRWTVPILWDTVSNKIVNNESAEICAIFDSAFDEWAANPTWTMNPSEVNVDVLKSTLDHLQTFAVLAYQSLFAPSVVEYALTHEKIYNFLDGFESTLGKQRFIAGSAFSEADIRLAVVLFRFDSVMIPLCRVTGKRVVDYPALSAYLRDVYQNVFDDHARQFWSEKQSQLGAFTFATDQKGFVPLTTIDFAVPVVDRSAVGQ